MSRFYRNFSEAANEIKRDLAELSIEVPPLYQSKPVSDDPDYVSKELHNYVYTVLDPDYELIPDVHEEFVKAEWPERLRGELNPGTAWRTRPEVWQSLREKVQVVGGIDRGKFSYTYSERMGGSHIQKLIDDFKQSPYSRQLYLPVWATVDEKRRGERRVPCSLGYWFVYRDKRIHMTYMMRSCDFITHWPNDVALASILLHYVAHQTETKVGSFCHFVGSLHVYAKDVEGVF
jgi:Thymidylate synthase